MIKRLSKAMGEPVVDNNLSTSCQYHRFISHVKRLLTARNLQSIKTFLAVEMKQYCKSGSTFSSREPVAAHSYYSRLGNTQCLR